MGKVTFVFSGQGDQHPGMGKALYEQYPAARAVFDMCESIRPGTIRQCFEGTEEELKETANTQPCLFAMELAAARVLMDKGITPDAVAGFSLGEVVAAAVSGMMTDAEAFRLVCRRGELMQQAADQHDTAMAAVVKLTAEQVEALCANYAQVYPVNYNCPGNITVSGLREELTAFSADVKAAGGRALPLKVKGAFHSPFMASASEAFYQALQQAELKTPAIALYANKTAMPYEGDAAVLLSQQICSPVRWEQTIRNLMAAGVDTFVEIGPGKTLTNMIKKITAEAKAVTCDEYLAEVEAC
ncbi:MAG: ACP S-malonyltransferase [Clostridia bacterium]|nr:ACP S-malonyltransferase [Clostridia bacterium]